MCPNNPPPPPLTSSPSSTPFPRDIPIHDAHCHPTDTRSTFPSIPSMHASTLVLMSTRAQDQSLVASAATSFPQKVIPSFGWHPWFSYQLYDDISTDAAISTQADLEASTPSQDDRKAARLAAVLTPAPSAEFVKAAPLLRPLSEVLAQMRHQLEEHPDALVGEVGLDRAFRLPRPWTEDEDRGDEEPLEDEAPTPGGREGRRLSPYRVKPEHQIAVVKAQLGLAAEYGRAASVHGVQAHGVLFEAVSSLWKGHERRVISKRERKRGEFDADGWASSDDGDGGKRTSTPDKSRTEGEKKGGKLPYPPRICLHSFSGSAETMKQWCNPQIPSQIFFSFSTAVNFGSAKGDDKTVGAIKACPDDRILAESDLHMAGKEMDAALEDVYRRICEIKGWELEDGVRRIGNNFSEFVSGQRA